MDMHQALKVEVRSLRELDNMAGDRLMSGKWNGASKSYVAPQAPGMADAWTQESAGRGGQRLTEVGEAPPPDGVRAALRLPLGEPAIVRRRAIHLDGEVIELTDSYYPKPIATGTPLAEHKKIRGGAPTLLASLGYQAGRVIEEVEARGATAEEAQQFALTPGAPVLTLLRTNLTNTGQPYEAMVMVMKVPRVLRYEMEVD
ncbi:UTRA domain-containing protein [Streptomyces sp. NPDC048211]|uniref:UTRA domain-containing protein n=1 Tax=Streptomyces sp. NPDC048211 TaxID=3365516 RepID=UPI00371E3592